MDEFTGELATDFLVYLLITDSLDREDELSPEEFMAAKQKVLAEHPEFANLNLFRGDVI